MSVHFHMWPFVYVHICVSKFCFYFCVFIVQCKWVQMSSIVPASTSMCVCMCVFVCVCVCVCVRVCVSVCMCVCVCSICTCACAHLSMRVWETIYRWYFGTFHIKFQQRCRSLFFPPLARSTVPTFWCWHRDDVEYVAVCCSMLQYVAVCCSGSAMILILTLRWCCSVLQCVAVCCIVLPTHCSVLQCVAVCCSVLQCVAVCCSVL